MESYLCPIGIHIPVFTPKRLASSVRTCSRLFRIDTMAISRKVDIESSSDEDAGVLSPSKASPPKKKLERKTRQRRGTQKRISYADSSSDDEDHDKSPRKKHRQSASPASYDVSVDPVIAPKDDENSQPAVDWRVSGAVDY